MTTRTTTSLALSIALLSTSSVSLAIENTEAAEFDAGMQRTAELAEVAWDFQRIGKDLCDGATAWLPGLYFSATSEMALAGERDANRIAAVFANGPAAAAGVQVGDMVQTINGEKVLGKTFRGEPRWDGVMDEATAEEGTMTLGVTRNGQPMDIDVPLVEACDILVAYHTRNLPIVRVPGMAVVTAMIDTVADEPWEVRAYLAPEIAASMNEAAKRQKKASKGWNIVGDVVGVASGGMLSGVGTAGGMGTAILGAKGVQLEGDRIGLYLLARLGDDITQVPAFWEQVYSYPEDGAGTLGGIRASLEDRREGFTTTIAEIQAKQEAGEPLNPGKPERSGSRFGKLFGR